MKENVYKGVVYNGDNLSILPKLDLEKVIFVSDPPFNIGYHYNTYKDKMGEDDYFTWLVQIFKHYPQVIIHYPESLYRYAFKNHMIPEKIVSWVYNSNNPKQHRDIAFFNIKPDFNQGSQPYKNLKDKRIIKRIMNGESARLYDWWNINQVKNVNKEKTIHPAQMPLDVMLNIISILPKDFIILDPFFGSGTTGVACQILNRDFIGIEIDKEYFEVSIKRLKQKYEKKVKKLW